MFGFLRLAFPSPVTIYVALGIMVASFGMGWTVNGWRLDARAAGVAHKVQKDKDIAAADAKKKIDAAEAKGRDLSTKLETAVQQINSGAASIQQEISNAKAAGMAAGRRACALSNDYVRLFNAGLHPADHPNPAPGGYAGAPGGAGAAQADAAAQADSGADEWDALSVGTENNRRWASCREHLNRLIDFETDDNPPVVTPSVKH